MTSNPSGVPRTARPVSALIRDLRPDVAIVDVRMPELDGIDVAREVARAVPETGVALCRDRRAAGHP